MTVDLCMASMLMLVSMTLTLMQGHSDSAKAKKKDQRSLILTTYQIISIKLATTYNGRPGQFFMLLVVTFFPHPLPPHTHKTRMLVITFFACRVTN